MNSATEKSKRFSLRRIAVLALLAPLLGICALLRLMGRERFGRMGRAFGRFLYRLGFRRRVVETNLELALGRELSRPELALLAEKIFENVGLTFLEIVRNFSLSKEQMKEELIVPPEVANRLKKVMESGRGAIFLSGHMANWELLGMGSCCHGYPVAVVAKKMNSPFAQALIERQRKRTGLEIIYSGGAIQKMKKALAEGKVIGFMMDQNVTGTKGIRTNFFGVPASSIRGLAGLVRETGVPVIPGCAFRLPDGTQRLHFLDDLPYLRDESLPAGSEERALREEWLNTQQYQAAIEKLVRMQPEHWLWIHRRWKTKRDPLDEERAHLENTLVSSS